MIIKTLKWPLLVVCLLALWITENSIDAPTADDQGLSKRPKSVPVDQNAYELLKHMDSEDFELSGHGEIGVLLRRHIERELWDEVFATKALEEHASIIDDILVAIDRPYFQFPNDEDSPTLSNYASFSNAHNLILLKSLSLKKRGDTDEALKWLLISARYSRMMLEGSSNLIEYMVSLTMNFRSVSLLHYYLRDRDVVALHYDQVQEVIRQIPDYKNDGFSQVFAGEYRYSLRLVADERSKPIGQRIQEHLDSRKYWSELQASGEDTEDYMPSYIHLIQTLIPHYYFHLNEFKTAYAPRITALEEKTTNDCSNLSFTSGSWKPSWMGWLSPNSQADEWLAQGTDQYEPFFHRRCLAHVYYDAVRATIGLLRYGLDNDGLPDDLSTLVPNHLDKLPMDYFTGGPLQFSKENQWFYSVGVNFTDDKGATDAIYEGRCLKSAPCYNNPTIPIFPEEKPQTCDDTVKESPQ